MYEGQEPQLQEILQYIVDDGQRASEVIWWLRSLLKKSEPESKPLDMNALINETVAILSTDVTVRNKVIIVELDTRLPTVRGDGIQLQQVLLNLISNSLDAMEMSDESRELMIRASYKDTGEALVDVDDSGCGISEKKHQKAL